MKARPPKKVRAADVKNFDVPPDLGVQESLEVRRHGREVDKVGLPRLPVGGLKPRVARREPPARRHAERRWKEPAEPLPRELGREVDVRGRGQEPPDNPGGPRTLDEPRGPLEDANVAPVQGVERSCGDEDGNILIGVRDLEVPPDLFKRPTQV